MLSRQDVLDCASQFGYGEGCDGGEAVDVLEYARQHGIPDESCNIYRAESSPQKCDMKKRCMNCMMVSRLFAHAAQFCRSIAHLSVNWDSYL